MIESEGRPLAFIGRGAAQAALTAARTAARRGRPRVVLLEGPPGFGKTTLLTDEPHRAGSARILRATAEPDEATAAYSTWSPRRWAAPRSTIAAPPGQWSTHYATCATRIAEDGATASEVMALLGHGSLGARQAYIDATAIEQPTYQALNEVNRKG